MQGIILQVGTVDEFLEELRIDHERLADKSVRVHVQLAPAAPEPGIQLKKGQEPKDKRNVWLGASAILAFGADPKSYYILRLDEFCGIYWLTDREGDNGYTKALDYQKLIKKFCEASGLKFRSGFWRFQDETV